MSSQTQIRHHDFMESTGARKPATSIDSYYEEDAEKRLEDLCDRLQTLNQASHLVWLKRGLLDTDPLLDVRTKVESVRWMLRIAKHLSASAREMIFSTIRNSLYQIERTVELGISASEIVQHRSHPAHS